MGETELKEVLSERENATQNELGRKGSDKKEKEENDAKIDKGIKIIPSEISQACVQNTTHDETTDVGIMNTTSKKAPSSDLSKISHLHNAALKDVTPPGKIVDDHSEEQLGPSFLVGKIIRLYCPVDNSYHTGRIVDWRAATVYSLKDRNHSCKESAPFYGSGEVGTSEFLVRFAPGMEGRKLLLLQWIILEEHSLAVGTSLIFGQLKKGRGLSGWKPAQTLLRTSLELVPVRHLLEREDASESYALSSFFGPECHVFLRLCDEAVDFFSPMFCARREGSTQSITSIKSSVVGPSTFSDLSISLALIEFEEQRRVKRWHKMPLQNPAHSKALKIKDEYALPPLKISRPNQDLECYDKQEQVHSKRKFETGQKLPLTRPKLCPLIEHGIDRFWLAHLMGKDKVERSVDTFESICVEPVSNLKSAIQVLQNH